MKKLEIIKILPLTLTVWLNQKDKSFGKMSQLEETTEEKILRAAKSVFIKKGLDGARMQEIADEAGINKALLHYYYRSKNLLFEAVYIKVFGQIFPQINEMFKKDLSLFDIIREFFEVHIEFLKRNRDMPLFVFREVTKIPDLLKKTMDLHDVNIVEVVVKKVKEAEDQGLIKPTKPEELMLNMVSLSVFQFVSMPMFQTITGLSEEQLFAIIDQRKKSLPEFVINAIKK